MATILLVSGPNLNLFGERDPEVYGTATLAECVEDARAVVTARGHTLEHVQSNHEGDLVDAVQGARDRCAALVVNAAALTHYGRSLHDALLTFEGPLVELHISNPHAREAWRHESVVAPVATAVVAGFGGEGYRLAIEGVAALLREASAPSTEEGEA